MPSNAKSGFTNLWAWLAAAVLLAPLTAQAEDMAYSSLLDRIESLETELSAQQQQFASFAMSGGGVSQSCGQCCEPVCCCVSPALYAGYEMTILRPYVSDANFAPGFADDYGVGHRFIVGYDGGDGLGVRARYWMYNHGHNMVPPIGPGVVQLDMDVFDLEATLHERLRNWDLTLAGGVRYGRLGFDLSFGNFGPVSTFFEGVGPTVAMEANRAIGQTGFYLLGNFRTALLIGEINNQRRNFFLGPVNDDELLVTLENQLGLGWTADMGCMALDLRAVWETQFWLNDTFADDFNGFGSNLGFSGPTFSARVRF